MRNPNRLKAFANRKDAVEAGKLLRDAWNKVERAGGENTNTAGGFLVADPIAAAIRDLRDKVGIFRQLATVVPMTSDTTRVAKRASGLTGYYTVENAQITESQIGWDQITLTARKIAAITRASSELVDDAAAFGEYVASELAYTLEQLIDAAAFAGDGTSTYGLQTGARFAFTGLAGVVTAAAGHDTWAEYDIPDMVALMGTLPARYHDNAVWVCSPIAYALTMCRLSGTAGGPLEIGGQRQFLGRTVVLTSSMTGGTAATDLTGLVSFLFGDFSQAALLGDRRNGTQVFRSTGRYLEYDQVAFRGTARFHSVWDGLGDGTTAGAVVALVGGT